MNVDVVAAVERLLTPKQVSELTSISLQTLAHRRSTRRQDLPFLAISNRCVRYRAKDVQAWIDSHVVGADQRED